MDSFVQECIETQPPALLQGLILKFRQVVSHSHVLVPVVEPDQIRSRLKKVNIHAKKKPRGARKQTRDPIQAEIVEHEIKMAAKKSQKLSNVPKKRNARRKKSLPLSGSGFPPPTDSESSPEDNQVESEEMHPSGSDHSTSSTASLEDLENMFERGKNAVIEEKVRPTSP